MKGDGEGEQPHGCTNRLQPIELRAMNSNSSNSREIRHVLYLHGRATRVMSVIQATTADTAPRGHLGVKAAPPGDRARRDQRRRMRRAPRSRSRVRRGERERRQRGSLHNSQLMQAPREDGARKCDQAPTHHASRISSWKCIVHRERRPACR
jgi:hypothetical protein